MTRVVPLRATRPAQSPLAPSSASTYSQVPAEARAAFTALEGRVNTLRRTFSATFATTAALDQLQGLCLAIEAEARRIRGAVS